MLRAAKKDETLDIVKFGKYLSIAIIITVQVPSHIMCAARKVIDSISRAEQFAKIILYSSIYRWYIKYVENIRRQLFFSPYRSYNGHWYLLQ